MLAMPTQERLERALRYMLDENEFLSPFGLRSVSRYHREHPYIFRAGNEEHRVDYVPGEGTSYLFGGNSNWRGPIWFPINYLIVEALERYHHFYGDSFKVECPTGSGNMMNLQAGGAGTFASAHPHLSCLTKMARAPATARSRNTPPIRIGATWFCSTNTSTAKPAAASAPAIKPAGPRSR